MEPGGAVLVSPFNVFDSELEFSLGNVLQQLYRGEANWAFAVGVENIIGSRGENTILFTDGAKIPGRLEPGNGGSLTLDYASYHDDVEVDLGASGIAFNLKRVDLWQWLPDWASTLVPDLDWQISSANRFRRRHDGDCGKETKYTGPTMQIGSREIQTTLSSTDVVATMLFPAWQATTRCMAVKTMTGSTEEMARIVSSAVMATTCSMVPPTQTISSVMQATTYFTVVPAAICSCPDSGMT